MANEFIARNGLIAQDSSTITGSLTVTQGITGSLFGTVSFATVAAASVITDNTAFNNNYYPIFAQGGGNYNLQIDTSTFAYNPSTNLLTTTSSRAISSSNALTASSISILTQDVSISKLGGPTLTLTAATAGSSTIVLTSDSIGGGDAVINSTLATGDLVLKVSGSEKLRIKPDGTFNITGSIGSLLVGTGSSLATPSYGLTPNLAIGMNTGSTGAVLDLRNTSASVSARDTLGIIQFSGKADSSNGYVSSQIRATVSNNLGSGTPGGGNISIWTGINQAGASPVERMRVNDNGQVLIGLTSSLNTTSKLIVSGSTTITGSLAVIGSAVITGSLTQGQAGNIASGLNSHAEGRETSASGNYSHAEGYGPKATLEAAHAEGYFTLASGIGAHSEGYRTSASGYFSHAEGGWHDFDGTPLPGGYAQGIGSHAEGVGTIALGDVSHAEGYYTWATGYASHAEGNDTTSSGDYSHTEGFGTLSQGTYQHVQGQWNIPSFGQSAFIHGNGTSNAARSNLIFASGSEVQITGSLKVSGSITGSLFGTASFAISSSRAVSSSYALTASYALNGGGGGGASFPYTGSAIITGSLIVTGSTTSTQGFVKPGAGSQYLLADGTTTASTGGSPFPYIGDAQITGSLLVSGSATFTGPVTASNLITKNIVGSTYLANSITALSLADFNAIGTKDANTLYFII